MPVISAQNLQKTFRSRGNKKIFSGLFRPDWRYHNAVEDVSFAIEKGEAVAFLGPNGAGKTTTTKMLTGLIHPSGGALKVLGYTPFERNYDFLKRIGLVMGNKAGLNWDLSASQSFELLQKIYELPVAATKKRVTELSHMLHVEHALERQVRQLSLGERMKLELIGAILHNPDILFLDEPTIGLDMHSKKNVREFLRHLHDQGKTLLLTSHDMDDVNEVCKRVIVINHGRIMYDDDMRQLTKHYSHIRYVRLEFSHVTPSRPYLQRHGQVVSFEDGTAVIGIDKTKVMKIAGTISREYPLADIAIEQVPLEIVMGDVYASPPQS